MTKRFYFSNGTTTIEQDVPLSRKGNEYYFEDRVGLLIAELRRQGFYYCYSMPVGS